MDMKKLLNLLLLTLLSVIILSACGGESAGEEGGGDDNRFDTVLLNVYEDKTTGCKYVALKTGYAGGLTNLLKEDGSPDCGN